jgi:hypothetical protein
MAAVTRENGETTKCMEMAAVHGQITVPTSVSMSTERRKALEYSSGLMVASIRVNGSTVSSTDAGSLNQCQGRRDLAYGKMGIESDGFPNVIYIFSLSSTDQLIENGKALTALRRHSSIKV